MFILLFIIFGGWNLFGVIKSVCKKNIEVFDFVFLFRFIWLLILFKF